MANEPSRPQSSETIFPGPTAWLTRRLPRLYGAMLRGYPRAFRAEFGDEMQAVFACRLAEISGQVGRQRIWHIVLALISLLGRELSGLLVSIVRSQWRRTGGAMNIPWTESRWLRWGETPQPPQPAARQDAFLAALPHGLIAALLVLTVIDNSILAMVSSFAAIATCLVFMIIGWRRGWPRWTASWYGYVILPALLLLFSLLQQLSGILRVDVESQYYIVGIPFLLAVVLVTLGLRDRFKALLVGLAFVPMFWMITLEFVPTSLRQPVQAAAWLLTGAAAYGIVRSGRWRLGVWLAVGVNLLTGVLFSLVRASIEVIPTSNSYSTQAITPQAGEVFGLLAPGFASLLTLIFAPPLVHALLTLTRRAERRLGETGFGLTLTGLAINFIGQLLVLERSMDVLPFQQTVSGPLTVVTSVGFLVYLVGFGLIMAAAQQAGRLPGSLLLGLLGLLPLLVPGLALLPLLYNFANLPSGVPFPLLDLDRLPSGVVQGAAMLLALVGVWLVAFLNGGKPSTSSTG